LREIHRVTPQIDPFIHTPKYLAATNRILVSLHAGGCGRFLAQ
jgi:hypothetical protein